jgi:hypothetical protein
MVEYSCECCNYTTNKKSTFDSHNVSKKHLEKTGKKTDVSTTSSLSETASIKSNNEIDNESYTTMKIRELENIIKIKDVEIKMKDEQIELLKQTIALLNKPAPTAVANEPPQSLEAIEEPKLFCKKLILKPNKVIKKENISMNIEEIKNDMVHKKQKPEQNLINIEQFFENYISGCEETKYTYKFETNKVKFTALKPCYYKKNHMPNLMKAPLEIILEAIKTMNNKNETFYICKDVSRRKFDIKSKDEIIQSKNIEIIDDLILWLFKKVYNFLFDSFNHFNVYFSKRWTNMSEHEENQAQIAQTKKLEDLPLTEMEKKCYDIELINNKVKNEFKKITNIDYEVFKSCDSGWSSNMTRAFYSFGNVEYDKGFIHLRTLLATNKIIEKDMKSHVIEEEDGDDEKEETYHSEDDEQ